MGHARAMSEPASSLAEQVISRATSESTPRWPEPVLPATGAPNVVVVLVDDTGFGGHLARVEIGTTRAFRPEEETAMELTASAEMQ